MIEGASRLIEDLEGVAGFEPDQFLHEKRDSINQNKARMMLDEEGYRAWLTELAADLAAETVRRNFDDRKS